MRIDHPHRDVWIAAAALGLVVMLLTTPRPASAQSPGFYSTRTSTSTSTSTSATDPNTGVTTTTTNTSTTTPDSLYGTDWRGSDSGSHADFDARTFRDRYNGNGGDRDPIHTSDTEARFPYDNTNGRNRSDVDAVRSGFDDPRNPWDGRYANDNPANYDASNSGSNAVVNRMRGNEADYSRPDNVYLPGNYGTTRVGHD